jgi:tRNA 2-thiocytidine biosynthesis protein TtcA
MFTAMGNITLSHMMDRNHFPFTTLQATGAPVADGDLAFDEEPCASEPATIKLRRAAPDADLED